MERVALLFVCLGNICRSPTAEAVMRKLVTEAGMPERFLIDSAGTGDWHVGSAPDRRASEAAASAGISLQGRARQISAADFESFDLILAMDRANLAELRRLAAPQHAHKLKLLREFDPHSGGDLDVPDPYYGGPQGFCDVLELTDAACRGLLEHVLLAQPK
jgi:protein-tyrosine phosphatase